MLFALEGKGEVRYKRWKGRVLKPFMPKGKEITAL